MREAFTKIFRLTLRTLFIFIGVLPTQQEMRSFYNSQDREIDIDFLESIDLSKQLAELKAEIPDGVEGDWKLSERDKQLNERLKAKNEGDNFTGYENDWM